MSPLTRLINGIGDVICGIVATAMDAVAEMDAVQFATLSICVLVIAAMCLRGNPVRGA